ncbi:MAG: hypothetical protein P8J59_04450 [Phycisphaerales bacterium]|jgi:hypothetical protein|nr:hypothetical protein [Phycisphaerales bacterium]
MSWLWYLTCGLLLLGPILIVTAILIMVAKRRFKIGILLILAAACSFTLALLPTAIYIVRVGPSTPGDANPVNIVDDFILGQYGGVWMLESPRTNSSFSDFDKLGINERFILLDGPTGGLQLVARSNGQAVDIPPATSADSMDAMDAMDARLRSIDAPTIGTLEAPETHQWRWALFGQP